jgi:ribonuclease HI
MPINWATVAGRKTLWCFTDGAYSSTKKEGASSFVMFGGLQNFLGEAAKKSKSIKTNNVGELTAIIDVLAYASQYKMGSIVILSDSEYCVKSVMIWYHKWVQEDTLGDKSNVDLISKIVKIIADAQAIGTKIKLQHVRGHQTEPSDKTSKEYFFWMGNDRADKMINYTSK